MYIKETIEKKYDEIKQVLCNICKKDCHDSFAPNYVDGVHGFMLKTKEHVNDYIEFDICRTCLENHIFPKFTLPSEEF